MKGGLQTAVRLFFFTTCRCHFYDVNVKKGEGGGKQGRCDRRAVADTAPRPPPRGAAAHTAAAWPPTRWRSPSPEASVAVKSDVCRVTEQTATRCFTTHTAPACVMPCPVWHSSDREGRSTPSCPRAVTRGVACPSLASVPSAHRNHEVVGTSAVRPPGACHYGARDPGQAPCSLGAGGKDSARPQLA